ncbi:DUF4879 domain-containing protein [Caloranaerobacter sp. DY30410]|uniref:DUF4879 domain-containing protein n=1 Tax=Caloranaerobacter sp. DY30410 TaxID=3238305 RepID=UPI003D05291B
MKKISGLLLITLLILSFCSVSYAASAPPLSQVGIAEIYSSQGGTEEIYSSTKLCTDKDHGGNPFYIVTYEIGYSRYGSRIAKLNGVRLKEVQSQPIDLDNDRIIDGWFRWWDASGFTGGNFTYEATSENYPWNTMSVDIRIR